MTDPVLKNTLNPAELETRAYRVGDRLAIRVYESVRIGDEDALGHCSLPCSDWAYPGGLRCEVRLTDNGRKTCAARLQIKVYPLLPYRDSRRLSPGCDSCTAEGSCTADASVPTNAPIPEQQQAELSSELAPASRAELPALSKHHI